MTAADHAAPTHELRYAARTDRGLVRSNNQDSVFAGDRLLVVADGMGGHAAGDAASRLVVDALAPLNDEAPPPDLISGLVAATARGNRSIAAMVAENPELDGMGTTLTAMLFDGARAALAHVGDSRAYLYRSGVLHQLSHDDSFVQSLVDEGRITEEQAHAHPQRNLLLRALTGLDMEPSVTVRELHAGDRFLLCSDGLPVVVDAEPIGDALAHPDPEIAADTLIQLALVQGGPDNVTVIVADVISTGDAVDHRNGSGSDPEATNPIQHLTRELPRVPLPPIPEEPAGHAELLEPDTEFGTEADADLEAELDAEDLDDELDRDPAAEVTADDAAVDDDDGAPRATRSDGTATGRAEPRPTTASTRARRRLHTRRRRTITKRIAVTLAVVVLACVALAGGAMWVRGQYYVGAQANLVGIFRGVNGSLFGLRFSSFEETSCGDDPTCTPIKVSDLQPAARHQVTSGITADSLADARQVMARLADKVLPICDQPTEPDAGTRCRVVK